MHSKTAIFFSIVELYSRHCATSLRQREQLCLVHHVHIWPFAAIVIDAPDPAQPVRRCCSSPATSVSQFQSECRKRTPVKLIWFRFICEKKSLNERKKKNAGWFFVGGSFATFKLCCVRHCEMNCTDRKGFCRMTKEGQLCKTLAQLLT